MLVIFFFILYTGIGVGEIRVGSYFRVGSFFRVEVMFNFYLVFLEFEGGEEVGGGLGVKERVGWRSFREVV